MGLYGIELRFMERALAMANIAYSFNETPVGCVVVRNRTVVGEGYNRRELDKDALAHAELSAIRKACEALGQWRLSGCDLYVTLEPCPMCAGAIINARIARVVFGAYDGKAGCFASVLDLNAYPFNHKPEVYGGVMDNECSALLGRFFAGLREKGSGISDKK